MPGVMGNISLCNLVCLASTVVLLRMGLSATGPDDTGDPGTLGAN